MDACAYEEQKQLSSLWVLNPSKASSVLEYGLKSLFLSSLPYNTYGAYSLPFYERALFKLCNTNWKGGVERSGNL